MANKKKRLFLVRNKGDDSAYLIPSVQPPEKSPVGVPCSCGDVSCQYNGVSKGQYDIAGSEFTFCVDGLADAGIKIAEGQRLEVKISRVAR